MAKAKKFGAFGGVFTPSILTILGVIMYMRLPMIIGEAGLFATLGIILVAHIISVTTGLSVSSIATDKKVQAGGTYYIISRSLGLPIGGTLGLALFVGLSFSVSLYLIGFSESFLNYWGFEVSRDAIRITGSAILIIVTIVTFISTSLALRTQYFIMAAIILSLLSIFFGRHQFVPAEPVLSGASSALPLMVLFGIFFPAVTGFEAGVSMSGDLKDPKSAIPKGTISAIVIGLLVYIGLTFFFSYTVDQKVLAKDPNVLLKIAWIPQLVVAGIWGATLSSALGSILAAPRILQATASDRITHRFFAKGTGASNEPRNALLLTFLIAETGILIGELNVIARIVSIFFITTYGFLNLSCAFERMTSADFRPAFKTPAWISLLGSIACMTVMIQLDFAAMIGATIILGSVYLYLKRKELTLQTGDAWSSLWASVVKSGLRKLRDNTLQSRNWRPNIIMFSGDLNARPYLSDLGKDISGRLGMLTGFELTESKETAIVRKKDAIKAGSKSSGFYMNQHTCKDIYTGMDEIVRIYGFNGIEPNTVFMGWSRNKNNQEPFVQFMKKLEKNNFNSIFMNYNPDKGFGNKKTIDIWWSGWGHNLTFAINLIRHLTSSGNWKDAIVKLLVIVEDVTVIEIIHKSLRSILEQYRVDMEIKVINNSINKLRKNEIIQMESANSDLTIVGIPDKKYQQIDKTYTEVSQLVSKMGTTLLINASENFESYNLVHEETITQKQITLTNNKLTLPSLNTASYPVIDENIQKIDSVGIEIHKQFHNKTIAPIYRENLEIIAELEKLYNSSLAAFRKFSSIRDNYHKQKQLFKIRNDLNFKTRSLLESILTEKLHNELDLLSSGIEWYVDKLDDDIAKYPKKLVIPFRIEEFKVNKSDRFGLKWFKVRKKILHPFSKTIIKERIRYRTLLRYYLRDNRYQYMNSYLKNFSEKNIRFIYAIKELLLKVENQMELFSKNFHSVKTQEKIIDEINTLFTGTTGELKKDITGSSAIFLNELLSDFRKNLQLLSYDLEKINCNRQLLKKRRKRKYYRLQRISLTDFSREWLEFTFHFTNKIYLDVILLSLKNNIMDETDEFILSLRTQIQSGLLNKIRQFLSTLDELSRKPAEILKINPQLNIDNQFFNFEIPFRKLVDTIEKKTEDLPESLNVSEALITDSLKTREEQESIIEVPVRQITKHFISSIFPGEIEEYLSHLNERMRKIILQVKDQVSYMYFELENLSNEAENEDSTILKVTGEIRKDIIPEENLAAEILEETGREIKLKLENAFAPLSHIKILESNRELSHFIMEYKGKKTLSRVESLTGSLKLFIKNMTVRILYSQSEGILLAKKIREGETQHSFTEQILDFITQISPDYNVYDKIPVYYKNLFSGRSSISEDFWIERKAGQAQFEKTYRHYLEGYRGGIMVLGERNSGKTAFCRYITRKYFNNEKAYHIFPPLYGSAKPEDFGKILSETTHMRGTTDEIFEKLQNGTVLVIHDLELWWEMSETGYSTLQLISEAIKKYSSKCLFIINMNQYTYKRINMIHNIEDSFIGTIFCRPFDSEDIKDLIMRRHKSGGMKIYMGDKGEDQLSDIRLAGLFNKFFNYSGGNPGLSLLAWVTQIKKVLNGKIYIEPPIVPNTGIFNNLNDDWQVILIQLIYHKRMDMNRLKNVLQLNDDEIVKLINSLLMTGLVKEKAKELYVINRYVDRFLTEYFHDMELI